MKYYFINYITLIDNIIDKFIFEYFILIIKK